MGIKRKPNKSGHPNRIEAVGKPEEDRTVTIARTVLRPTVQAAVTLKEYNKSYVDLDLSGLIDSLAEQTRASSDGDLRRAEAMLTAQAHTLDAIFNNLARRAALNMGEYMPACETYLKLALRAQSQCRATWETLATIKNPPLVGYARQANIAHGPQQVNNASPTPKDALRAGKVSNPQNELLEKTIGERLDVQATGRAGTAHPAVATVGEVDRTKNEGGQR
jgi:hypothetical protein